LLRACLARRRDQLVTTLAPLPPKAASSNTVVSSSDPARALNLVGAHPVAMMLRHDGGAVVDTVRVAGRALALGSELQRLEALLSLSPVFRTETASVGPVAREGYVATYSAYAGKLFLLGGRAADTGVLLDDAWQYDVETGTWSPLVTPHLRHVKAAAYVFSDASLWVLDEGRAEEGHHREARLLRLDTAAGTSRVIGKWRAPDLGHRFLTTLSDGGLLLSGSETDDDHGSGHYVAFRLSAGAKPSAIGRMSGRGNLLAAPFVDELGLGVVVRDHDGTIHVGRTQIPVAQTGHDLERECEGGW
jgi:hypothetical protein